MKKKSKEQIALIGYGYWGKILYRYLTESSQFDLTYVHFPSLKKFDDVTIEKDYGKEFVSEIETIWKDNDVRNVVIATPIKTHFAVTQDALNHSKNVLVEKPLTLTKKEAQTLKKLSQQKKCVLMTEYTYTFSKALQKMQQIIEDGLIGSIENIQISLKQLGRFLGYDVFALLGSHALSILDLFVSLESCRFSMKPLRQTDDLITSGLINFESEKGVQGCIDVTLHSPQREKKVVLNGKKGNIVYNPLVQESVTVSIYKNTSTQKAKDLIDEKQNFSFEENHNLRYALEEFFDVIKDRKESNIDRAVAVTAILESLKKNE